MVFLCRSCQSHNQKQLGFARTLLVETENEACSHPDVSWHKEERYAQQNTLRHHHAYYTVCMGMCQMLTMEWGGLGRGTL